MANNGQALKTAQTRNAEAKRRPIKKRPKQKPIQPPECIELLSDSDEEPASGQADCKNADSVNSSSADAEVAGSAAAGSDVVVGEDGALLTDGYDDGEMGICKEQAGEAEAPAGMEAVYPAHGSEDGDEQEDFFLDTVGDPLTHASEEGLEEEHDAAVLEEEAPVAQEEGVEQGAMVEEATASSKPSTELDCEATLTPTMTTEEAATPEGSSEVKDMVKSRLPRNAQKTSAASSKKYPGVPGYLFMCNNATLRECESRRLLAAPEGELARMQRSITGDTQLFLLNFQTSMLMGPFVARGSAAHDIEPGAFNGKFRSQIRVAPRGRLLMEMKMQVGTRLPAGPKTGAEVATVEVGLWSGWGKPVKKKVQEAWSSKDVETTTAVSSSLDHQSGEISATNTKPGSNAAEIVELDDESSVVHNDPYGSDSLDVSVDAGEPSSLDGADVIVDRGAEFRAAFDDLPDTDETVLESSEGVDVWQGPIPAGKACELSDADRADLAATVVDVDKDAIEVCRSGSSSASDVQNTDNANGFVFFCNSATQKECATLKLLGSHERALEHMKHTITPATQIFLFNFDSGKLLGTFAAVGEPELNINPRAFTRRFNAQVRVRPREPLLEAKLTARPSAGGKTAEEVAALMALLSGAGEAPEQVRKAWSADSCDEPPPKRQKVGGGGDGVEQVSTVDDSGRPFNLHQVVVNFANVGASYAEKVLGRDQKRGDRIFDWEGVRRCISTLIEEEGMQVIGVLFENFKGPDNGCQVWQGVPMDIAKMCTSIQETPRVTGRNHKSADDEVTIKCAFRRNCRFLDNDNYRDWLNNMRNPKVRAWLEKWQELLQMRYFFDAQMGTFDTLDGNILACELAGSG